jgi:hypothetical protein
MIISVSVYAVSVCLTLYAEVSYYLAGY